MYRAPSTYLSHNFAAIAAILASQSAATNNQIAAAAKSIDSLL